MKKRNLTLIILLILALIITVIVVDFMNNRPDRRGGNPYELDVDRYEKVDPGLISHKEARDLKLGNLNPGAMVLYQGLLYLAGDSSIVVISPDGTSLASFPVFPSPTSILVDSLSVLVGYRSFVASYSATGLLENRWEDLGERAVITNLAAKGDRIYVADAGNRQVVIFSRNGERMGAFRGGTDLESGHGFIIPSPNFDLAVDPYGELWVVNPGNHTIENYTGAGRLRGFWGKSSLEPDGFAGCCNPARIAIAADGSFVTSEKGLVWIRIYNPSGTLRSVVASPGLFKEEGEAPDVCVDSSMVVYALDYDNNMIRIFTQVDHE